MSFDLVYKQIGEIGRYQLYVLLLGWLTGVYGGLYWINSVFLLYIPDHRCAIPGYDNDTYEVQNEAHHRLINESIPVNSEGEYEQCQIYVARDSNQSLMTEECYSWVYDKSLFTATLGAKLNLVCDRAILKSTAQMIFFTGVLIGSFVSGLFSDRFGRKPTLCISSMLVTMIALSIAWTPNVGVYMFQSACVGCVATGIFLPNFVISMEFVGPTKRLFAGQFGSLFWTMGNMIMAGLAYMFRDWSTFQIICAAPGALFLSYWFLFPESPRWLYFKGRRKELKKLLLKTANINRRKISENFFETFPAPKKEEASVGFHKLFSHRTLAIRTCVLYVNWIAVCMASYGLALNSDGLGEGSGVHLYFVLQMLMDLPATIMVLLLTDRIGRKSLMICSMLLGGLACIGTVFTVMYGGNASYISTLVLALAGRLGASVGFHLAYQYSAELFPTVVRNSGMGSCSCMARIGGILAPLVADLDRLVGGKIGKALPLLVFGVLSVFAGSLLFLLPETTGRELPGTIQDGIDFAKQKPGKTQEQIVVLESLLNDNTKYEVEDGGIIDSNSAMLLNVNEKNRTDNKNGVFRQ